MTLQPAHSAGEWSLFWMTLLTSTSHTAMHCRSFRTMTPWNVLNSSAIAPFNEPCKKSEDGVTSQLRRSLIVCCMISLSKCGVIVLYGSMHFACLLILLHGFLPFELCLWLLITTRRDRSFGQVCASSPRVLHSVFCDGCMDDFTWSANLPERQYLLSLLGVLSIMTTATLLPTEDGRFMSFALWPYAQVHMRGR